MRKKKIKVSDWGRPFPYKRIYEDMQDLIAALVIRIQSLEGEQSGPEHTREEMAPPIDGVVDYMLARG